MMLVAVVLLSFTARADSGSDTVLYVSIPSTAMSNQQFVTLSFDCNMTAQTIFNVDLNVSGIIDNNVSATFSNTPTFVQFGNGGLQVLNFMDQFGNLLQLDVFNNSAPSIGSLGPGTYLAPLDIFCNANNSLTCEDAFDAGIATVTDPPASPTPEPAPSILLAMGLMSLILLRLKSA
jgi:hypothetical protein